MKISELFPSDLTINVNNHQFHSRALLQDDALWRLSVAKENRFNCLRNYFTSASSMENVNVFIVGKTLKNVIVESENYFRGIHIESCTALFDGDGPIEAIRGSIVFLTSGETDTDEKRSTLSKLYDSCDSTIFIGWDTDNHHALSNSLFLAANTDLYCPTHNENLYEISRLNTKFSQVSSGVIMWEKHYIDNNIDLIINSDRVNDPYGRHKYYSIFSYRNKVISTLSNNFKSVGFQDSDLIALDEDDSYFEALCHHKIHWIVPVLNDLSIRVFDVFITGGIPIIPESLKNSVGLVDICRDDIVFYNPMDIVDPWRIVNSAINLFDAGGKAGILRRLLFGRGCHADYRLSKMLIMASSMFGIKNS